MLTFIKNTCKKGSHQYALYKCKCGTVKELRVSAVNNGGTQSCGCLRVQTSRQNGKKCITHGQTGTYLYQLWQSNIKNNCCWNNFEEFYNWIKPLWKPGLTLKDIDGYYNEQCELINGIELKKQKTSATNLTKYGHITPLQNEQIKTKIRKTNLTRYGNEVAAKTEIVKNNTRINNKKKYGVSYPQQLPENRQKAKKKMIDLIGYDSELWSSKINIARSTFNMWIRKYGFDQAINMTKQTSSIEQVINNFLNDINVSYVTNKKLDNYFPDIVIPDYKLIIELDGLYWHSDAINTNTFYHKNKLNTYESLGYTCLFFRENEICDKLDIVKSIILNKLYKVNKIFARKCRIIELDKDTAKEFFNKNHLMGAGRGKCYGLEYNGDLVCGLRFTNRDGIVDISRFCNVLNYQVLGGYSKLINHIIKNNKVKEIHTFVDRRYGSGSYLNKLGFNLVNEDISFVWVKNYEVFHRLKFRGNSGYSYGYYKLWDCGQAKYIKKAP